ncbi:MAG TPA: CHAT domain-containing tetratricopeptide repeat protein [Pyrinomonadaceae bacterium]|jgi:CHAT domain-containing protein/tetratricopeptide (TPR) repeat protein|nr:CHAT domain-containing tetratricopeptide repeat protein [Pyrinomonadaceae bacterium]
MKPAPRLLTATLTLASLLPATPATAARTFLTASLPNSAAQSGPTAAAEREQGHTLLRRGNAAEALVHLERALDLYQSSGDRAGEAATHDLLGELYERQGRYDVSLSHYNAALQLFGRGTAGKDEKDEKKRQRIDAFNYKLTLAKAGQMLYRTGRLADARKAYESMKVDKPDTGALGKAKRAGPLGIGLGVGRSSDNRGVEIGAPALGALGSAKLQYDHYRHAMMYAAQELGLGRLDYQSRRLEDARGHFDNVLDVTHGDLPLLGKLGQTRRYRVAARTSLGDTSLLEGKLEEAAKLYEEAAEGAEKDKRPDLMWPAQRGLARALWLRAAEEKDEKKAVKKRLEALAAYRAALRSVESLRQGGVRADEARTTFLSTTRVVFEEAAGALAEMAMADAGYGDGQLAGKALEYAAEGLQVVEQGRARSLLDMLGEAGARITEGIPPDLLKKRQENLEKQQEVARLLTGIRLTGSDESAKDLEAEADRLQLDYESVENSIQLKSPRYAALTLARPLALADIQRQVLDDETALVEYALGDSASYLWAVTRGGAALYRLAGRPVVEQEALRAREQILPASLRRPLVTTASHEEEARGLTVASAPDSTWDAAAFAAASHRLYQTALGPAAKFVGTRRLLVVPEGALSYFPFEAFVTAPGGADFSELQYLVKSNEVAYAPSASVVAALRQQARTNEGTGSVLVVADPVFNSTDPRAARVAAAAAQATLSPGLSTAVSDVAKVRLDSVSGAAKLRRLAGTREEAEQIKGLAGAAGLGADVWLDLDASESNASTRDLRGYRVIHFATHGLLDAERPQFTGLVLSLVGNGAGSDGFLRTDEVFNLRLGSPLVMLSACETGLGKERRGEGVIGLTRAFMYAGAPSVGVTLWSVSDRSTAELMSDFYRRLLAREAQAPPGALRAARLGMIADKRRSAPYYWAPFVLVGDWR